MPKQKKYKKQNGCLRRPYKQLRKEETLKEPLKGQNNHRLSLGPAVGWSKFHEGGESPPFIANLLQSLRFPQQSFHTTLGYKQVNCSMQSAARGGGSQQETPSRKRTEQEGCKHCPRQTFATLPFCPQACPICHHQQRKVVRKGTLCSRCMGPVGSSCHLAGLRILGQDLNHQGHLQSRSEWRLCHYSQKGHLGPTKSLGPHQLPTWPRCIVIWAADKAQRSRITGLYLGVKISYPCS